MTGGAAVAIASFSVRANLRSWPTRAGLAAGVAITFLGPLLGLSRGEGWALDPEMAFYGALVGSLFSIRSGLGEQHETGLALFLRHNLVTPTDHALGAFLSALASWILFSAVWFCAVLVAAGTDPGAAVWHTWIWLLRSGVLLPFVPMVESVSRIRIPLLIPLLGYLVVIVVLGTLLGEERMVRVLGSAGDRTSLAGSLPLAARAAGVLGTGLLLFVGTTALRARRAGIPARGRPDRPWPRPGTP